MMSNKQFKTKYQRTAAGWRGKKQLQKNGEIVLKNISGGNSRLKKRRDNYGDMEFQGASGLRAGRID